MHKSIAAIVSGSNTASRKDMQAFRSMATSPNLPLPRPPSEANNSSSPNHTQHIALYEGQQPSSQNLTANINSNYASINMLENAMMPETESERKEGDVKVKEGLAFLRKFYNERASVLSEKPNNVNDPLDLIQAGMGRTGSMGIEKVPN